MTQEISSLMDGELDPAQAERAIKACCLSKEDQETWHLYHVIGDSLRGQAPRSLRPPASLKEKLAVEPAIIARPRRVLETPAMRVALAAAASVATIGVVGWIGTQGGQLPGSSPVVAKSDSAVAPVANKMPLRSPPTVDVQDYYTAHKQLPVYRPVVNRPVPSTTAR